MTLLVVGSCDSPTAKKNGEIVSALESGGKNDEKYNEENAAAIAQAEKEMEELAQSVTTMKLDKMEHNFGKIKLDSENFCEFKVTNTGKKPLMISDVQASCGCTTPKKPEKPMIAPGDSDVIKVKFKPSSKSIDGVPVSKTVTITANTEPRLTVVTIKGIVL
jgi:hypothetical protein